MSAGTAPGAGTRRAVEIDALRTFAIIEMIASHGARLIKRSERGPWTEPVLTVDPLGQVLFLGLVGASLAMSWDNAQRRGADRRRWLSARGRRGAQLYVIGLVLFFFDKGLQWPWLLVAPTILGVIALGILSLSPVASSRRPLLWSGLAAVLGIGVAGLLQWQGVELPPVNGGPAPYLPLLGVTALGLFVATAWVQGRSRLVWGTAGAILLAAGAALTQHDLVALYTEPVGRTTMEILYRGDSHGLANSAAVVSALLGDGAMPELDDVEYFNPSVVGLPAVLATVVVLLGLFRFARPLLARVHGSLLLIGRYSLGAYVLHLALLGLPVIVEGRSKPLRTTEAGDGYVLFVILACYAYAAGREWQVRRGRARAAASSADRAV